MASFESKVTDQTLAFTTLQIKYSFIDLFIYYIEDIKEIVILKYRCYRLQSEIFVIHSYRFIVPDSCSKLIVPDS